MAFFIVGHGPAHSIEGARKALRAAEHDIAPVFPAALRRFEMAWQNPGDSAIAALLSEPRRIAVVGASANPARPSAGVLRWLAGQGHTVVAINPGLSGPLFGVPVAARLADLPGPVDIVDVFRNSAAAGDVVEEVLALPWRPEVIWMQLGVVNIDAAARAEAAGITVVMDRCPVIEARRLGLAA